MWVPIEFALQILVQCYVARTTFNKEVGLRGKNGLENEKISLNVLGILNANIKNRTCNIFYLHKKLPHMRKDRLYLFTFLSLAIIFLVISSIANSYFVEEAVEEVLSTQLEFSKREAKQMAILIGSQLENGISSDTTISNVQESIENSNLDAGFISVFDWSGKVVCHPDI